MRISATATQQALQGSSSFEAAARGGRATLAFARCYEFYAPPARVVRTQGAVSPEARALCPRRDQRQAHRHGRAALERAVDADGSTVFCHDGEGDREPEPRAFADALRGEKGLENAREHLDRDAGAAVRHDEH